MFTEDLSVFFDTSVFATEASWGALTASVIINSPTEDILGGRAVSNEYEMLLPTAKFPGINRGDQVVVAAGQYAGTYVLREKPMLMEDGAVKKIVATKL